MMLNLTRSLAFTALLLYSSAHGASELARLDEFLIELSREFPIIFSTALVHRSMQLRELPPADLPPAARAEQALAAFDLTLRFDGKRFDCGSKAGFINAQVALSLRHEDIADRVRAFIAEL